MVGDRITRGRAALRRAVGRRRRHRRGHRAPRRSSCPFAVFSLLAGVRRRPRRRRGSWSPPTSCGWSARRDGHAAARRRGRGLALALLSAVFGTGDAFFSPAFTGLMPLTVAAPPPAAGQRAARVCVLDRRRSSARCSAGPRRARRAREAARCSSTRGRSRSRSCLLRACAREVAPSDERCRAVPARPARRAGARCARAAGCWAFLVAMVVYHVVVLPSIFVLGPVLAEEELTGATSWAMIVAASAPARSLGDILLAALAAAGSRCSRRPSRSSSPPARRSIIGSGLPLGGHRRARVRRRRRRVVLLHAVGDVAPGADPRRRRSRACRATTSWPAPG